MEDSYLEGQLRGEIFDKVLVLIVVVAALI